MNRSIIAVLITLLATLAMVVPLGLSALSASQANAVDGQDETASRKPLLYRMLAFNDKIDSWQDELRMDFILRVKHNEFKPDCVDLGKSDTGGKAKCNLSFIYQYVGSDNPADYYRIRYINSITPDNYLENNKNGHTYDGAVSWAGNHVERFTVHKIINSGLYDYLAVS
ncbi:MAG: hypothetical protein M3Z40_03970, partial [Bifidobacterium sp.]|nr:hypothetical protein [Bifidobacterium sp.]